MLNPYSVQGPPRRSHKSIQHALFIHDIRQRVHGLRDVGAPGVVVLAPVKLRVRRAPEPTSTAALQALRDAWRGELERTNANPKSNSAAKENAATSWTANRAMHANIHIQIFSRVAHEHRPRKTIIFISPRDVRYAEEIALCGEAAQQGQSCATNPRIHCVGVALGQSTSGLARRYWRLQELTTTVTTPFSRIRCRI